jgi:dTMP kinase
MPMSGKLLVIDGTDGAGKATQVALLAEHLRAEGKEVETMDFPQYQNNIFGKLIRECLDGKRGDFLHTDARVASTLYAADRFQSKPQIEQWLKEGKIVVLDRYVSANMLHQGGKLRDAQEIEEFLTWLDEVEHGLFGLPRPDTILYLDVPLRVRKRLKLESIAAGKHGANVAADQHEADDTHQEQAEAQALRLVATKNVWHRIDCTEDGEIRSREAIHESIYSYIKTII